MDPRVQQKNWSMCSENHPSATAYVIKAPLTLRHLSGPLLHCLKWGKSIHIYNNIIRIIQIAQFLKGKWTGDDISWNRTFCQVKGSNQVHEGETETMIFDENLPA